MQEAAIEVEKLVKGDQKKMPPSKQLNQKLAELENTLNRALESVHALGIAAEDKATKPSDEELAAIPAESIQDLLQRMRDAAESLVREIRMPGLTRRGMETGSKSTAPFLDPTCEGLGVKFPRATRPNQSFSKPPKNCDIYFFKRKTRSCTSGMIGPIFIQNPFWVSGCNHNSEW